VARFILRRLALLPPLLLGVSLFLFVLTHLLGDHLHRHAEGEMPRISLDVDERAAHAHALGEIDDGGDVGRRDAGADWCTIE